MPLRSWVQRSVPGMLALTRRGVEHPGVGVPGVCNFVDGERGMKLHPLRVEMWQHVARAACCVLFNGALPFCGCHSTLECAALPCLLCSSHQVDGRVPQAGEHIACIACILCVAWLPDG